MLKAIRYALLFLPFTAQAYVISSNLIIENNTATNMDLIVSQPHGQATLVKSIPANASTEIYLENGDKTGLLYQASLATFSLKETAKKTVYVNGRIAYYIGSTYWDKYSFLDSVYAGSGIKIDKTYSCARSGMTTTFQNKIVLSGEHLGHAPVNPNRGVIHCEGLKNTSLESDDRGQFYKITCSDNTESTFLKQQGECELVAYGKTSWYSNGCYWVKTGSSSAADIFLSPSLSSRQVKTELDKMLGSSYCRDFAVKLA